MAGGNVIGSQKEMTAVINNLKETRVLDKAIDTLSLEESYAVKLLHLDTKMIKLKYSRLENNVGRIKTNLNSEDISAMRCLELEGKFKAESPIVASTSHSKILAAAKRLKFNSNSYRRAISATPRLEKHQIAQYTLPLATSAGKLEVASSIQSTTPSRLSCTRQSIMSDQSEVAAVLCRKVRPHSSASDEILLKRRRSNAEKPTHRPNTAQILERIATAQKARKNHCRQTLYSCHDGKTDSQDGYVGGVFGPSPYEIRRRRFLDEEHSRISHLVVRQKQFLGDTTKFVKENPCVYNMRPEKTEEVIKSIDSMTRRSGSSSRLNKSRQCKSLLERTDSADLLRQFAEIKKTRFLRINDSSLDLSGVITLAKTQQELSESWHSLNANNSRVSFKVATAL